MSFTFSSNEATDYPALGMCDTCGKRFTQGCEHSNTIEAQEWLAAHIVAEQTISLTDEDANDISNLIATAEAEIFTDGFADERLTKEEQIKEYFGEVKVTTSNEWQKRHLN